MQCAAELDSIILSPVVSYHASQYSRAGHVTRHSLATQVSAGQPTPNVSTEEWASELLLRSSVHVIEYFRKRGPVFLSLSVINQRPTKKMFLFSVTCEYAYFWVNSCDLQYVVDWHLSHFIFKAAGVRSSATEDRRQHAFFIPARVWNFLSVKMAVLHTRHEWLPFNNLLPKQHCFPTKDHLEHSYAETSVKNRGITVKNSHRSLSDLIGAEEQ